MTYHLKMKDHWVYPLRESSSQKPGGLWILTPFPTTMNKCKQP